MKKLKKNQSTYLLLYTAILLCTSAVNAAEGGGSSYMPGFYGDFGMAVAPEPGNYLSNSMGYNTVGNDANGSN